MPATLNVGSRLSEFATIQAAVNAAHSGDLILVDPGVYQAQVSINKSITLASNCRNSQGSTIILAPANLGSATVANPDAIVHVTGNGVIAEIEGFTIEGAAAGTPNLLYGVRVDGGASAAIVSNTITNIIDSSNSQAGVGIAVGSAADSSDGLGAQVGSAFVTGNSITNYQRAGIVISNTGSWAIVQSNNISATNHPLTATLADSVTGVEVSDGASATVAANCISNNYNDSDGCGVLLYTPGQGTEIAFNTIQGNDYGLCGLEVTGNAGACGRKSYGGFNCGGDWGSSCGGAFGNRGVSIDANTVSANTYQGVEFDYSSGVYVSANCISRNGADGYANGGIFLYQSTGNVVSFNLTLNNNGSGIFVDAGSKGNTILGNIATGNVYSVAGQSADVVDLSTGAGSDGTANTWTGNIGAKSIDVSGQSLLNNFGFWWC